MHVTYWRRTVEHKTYEIIAVCIILLVGSPDIASGHYKMDISGSTGVQSLECHVCCVVTTSVSDLTCVGPEPSSLALFPVLSIGYN